MRILQWAARRGLQDADRRDLVQDVLLALRKGGYAELPIDQQVRVSYRIAGNLYARLLRDRSIKHRALGRYPAEGEDGGDPAHLASRNELARKVYGEILRSLGEVDRKILVARALEDRPFREIAEEHGMSHDAVRQRYVRALNQVRASLFDNQSISDEEPD
jgi:RNA polymerase sigma factor (sigma-70 family)